MTVSKGLSGIRIISHLGGKVTKLIAQCKEICNPWLWNLEYSSRNPEPHLLLECGIQVPLTKNPESRTCWNPESTVWNPESETVLDSLTWGENSALMT